jgi:hypothetical protein
MNTPYDVTESAILISKLVALTRDGKVEWIQDIANPVAINTSVRYQTTMEGNLEVLVWSTSKSAGFRLFENVVHRPEPAHFGLHEKGSDSLASMPVGRGLPTFSERDLVAISIGHEEGPARGEVYINLMSLLELARRSADKIEPKVDRVKQYLDKLAV